MGSPAENLARLINSYEIDGFKATEIPEELQISSADLKALSEEMKERIGRNITARSNSVISASNTSIH